MQITDPAAIRTFVKGGRAVFTLVSKRTGTRFTYRVAQAKDNVDLFFVSVLTQPDNTEGYTYIGIIRGGVFSHGRKSPIGADAPSVRGFQFFHQHINYNDGASATAALEFWHEGRCCRCARRLTVPSSIASGIGPECAGKFMAEAA